MSYFTAPSAPDLALSRIQRAATSSALANKDLQTFVSGDLREILSRGPQFQQAIIAAYRNALPQNQAVFESLIADADPAVGSDASLQPAKMRSYSSRFASDALKTGIKFAWSSRPRGVDDFEGQSTVFSFPRIPH